MARYYKSRFMAEPVVYIQEDDTWRSHGQGGETRNAEGEIPEHILKYVTEITQAEAQDLIAFHQAKAEGRAPHPPVPGSSPAYVPRQTTYAPRQAPYATYVPPQPKRIGGYLIFVIIWLGLTMMGGLSVLGTTTEFAQVGVPSAVTDSGMGSYGGAWVAIIIIDILGALALIAVPILIFVFMSQRRRSTRWLMIGFCCFAIVLAVLDVVLATTFGIDSLREAGLPDSADALIGEQIASMFGAIIGLLFVLPYLLSSERVRDTFTGRRAPAAVPVAVPTGGPGALWMAAPFPGSPATPWPSAGPPQWAPLTLDATPDGAPVAAPEDGTPTGAEGAVADEPPRPDLFCPRCGAARPPAAQFCPRCGRGLS